MRRLIVTLDGTWNNPQKMKETERGYSVHKPSNPLKIYRAVNPGARDGVDQISFYDEGVGSAGNTWDKLTGGIWGSGFEKNVEDAYRFLVGNYRSRDQIYAFGFSRGAATARSLCRFIEWTGGLLKKTDSYYIPDFFKRYCKTRGRAGAAAELMQGKGRRRPIKMSKPRPVKIRFLGVFDTVLALGSRVKAATSKGKRTSAKSRSFHVGARPPAIVKIARQALAIDERRKDFAPEVWKGPGAPGQSLAQRWFPGVHTNVGGGYEHDGLANAALHWMAQQAEEAELDLNMAFLKHYRPWFGDVRYESLKGIYKILGPRRRELDGGPEACIELDPSVLKLLALENKKQSYRPKNLCAYVASRPELWKGLSDDVLKEIKRRAR